MKKLTLFATACMALFASCSKDEKQTVSEDSGKVTFEVSIVNTLETRANLYSQEAVHEVENVQVYVFTKNQNGDYLYSSVYGFNSWPKGSNFQRNEIPTNTELPAGDYKFLAVGRDASDNFTGIEPIVGVTLFDNMAAAVSQAGQETEIFAGSTSKTITASTGARISIQMTRQVAGVLGYFKNVPAEINGSTVAFLRLSISNANTKVNLVSSAGSLPTASSHNLIDVDLRTQLVTSGGVYVGNDLSGQGVMKVDNSQLNGAFVIPVSGITMTLGLYANDGTTALKTWNIVEGATSVLDIQANHFYALGTKVAKGSTTGTPTDPTPDDPIDLLTNQEIAITISPVWTAIHDLTIQ